VAVVLSSRSIRENPLRSSSPLATSRCRCPRKIDPG
jgi:hypothetical protein